MLNVTQTAKEKCLKSENILVHEECSSLELLESYHEMLVEAVIEKFGLISQSVSDLIRDIRNMDVIKELLRQVLRSKNIEEFGNILRRKHDMEYLKEVFEYFQMQQSLETAKEKAFEEGRCTGFEEGKSIGIKKGMREGRFLGILENTREMLTDALIERFSLIPQHISERIRNMDNRDVLKGLFRQVFRCGSLQEFEKILNQV
ncbi:MAG: hypothetical protein AB7S75_24495 [Desulfococcaceae bacterium]